MDTEELRVCGSESLAQFADLQSFPLSVSRWERKQKANVNKLSLNSEEAEL